MIMLLLLTMQLIACGSGAMGPSPVPTPSGLSREQAIAAAQRAYPSDGVISADAGTIDRFEPDQARYPGNHLVWAVVVSGQFAGACGPALLPGWTPHPCASPATRATVIVDFVTGQFIMASFTLPPAAG
jgi:hypothetical protein